MSRRGRELAPFLDALAERYHKSGYLGSDPLQLVHEFSDGADQEIAGLFCALLAYGNVKQILASLRRLFAAMDGHPARFVLEFEYPYAARRLRGFKHRFTDEEDILCLCYLLHQVMREHGALETLFVQGMDPQDEDLVGAAGRFINRLHSHDFAPHFDRERMLRKGSFKHLLPRADKGSACKRIHLWLRWMVRPADGVDLGLWTRVPAAKLVVPVDTHVLRIAQNLGLVKRRNGSLLAAREITSVLRAADSADPVRYDFAICRLGILKACPSSNSLEQCRPCELHDVCRRRAKLERTAARRNRVAHTG
jgi:uncharacterized protein (TIGR02757 family)